MRVRFLPLSLCLLAAGAAIPAAHASPSLKGLSPKIEAPVPLAFRARPAADGSRRVLPAAPRVPVVVTFSADVGSAELAAIEATGARISARPSLRGSQRRVVAIEAGESAIGSIAAWPHVEHIALDGPLFAPPPPLDLTAQLAQTADVRFTTGSDGLPRDGHGMTVCDIDSGIDPLHPLFFRAGRMDGSPGYEAWVDVNEDGSFTPGVDAVDLAHDGVLIPLGVLNAPITPFWSDEPQFGSGDPTFLAGMDWLYADMNGSGFREAGTAAGFTEQTPTYGEQLFAADDVNRNGKLDIGEKIVLLGPSKIKSVRVGLKDFRRGENLIDVPVEASFDHGTGAAGVLVGGNMGINKLVGMAPGADIVMGVHGQFASEYSLAKFCIAEGARVVLHEYAPWVGYHLDGSSTLEKLIDDSSADGVSHVNPAGNLSGSSKLMKRKLPVGATTDIPIEVPDNFGIRVFAMSLLWQDTSRDLTLKLTDGEGASADVPITGGVFQEDWPGGLTLYAQRIDSKRGTVRADIYVFGDGNNPPPIATGTWHLEVTDPGQPADPEVTLIGYVMDEVSGWGVGIRFLENVTEEHLIGYPGTADHGMPIAAYTGHGYWGGTPGERADYSGRGVRIDGTPIMSISGPDDPITSGYREGQPGVYFIYGGTSGASPHVAGAATLLLAEEPALTGDEVKERLQGAALADEVVLAAGPVPNADFGYGKLHAYNAIFGQDPPGGTAPTIAIAPLTVVLGGAADLHIQVTDADEPATGLHLRIDRDYDGIYDEDIGSTLKVTGDALGTFISKVEVKDATGRSAAALAVIDVVEAIDEGPDENPEEVVPGGAGPCAWRPGSSPRGAFFGAGALALAFALRRIRARSTSRERTPRQGRGRDR